MCPAAALLACLCSLMPVLAQPVSTVSSGLAAFLDGASDPTPLLLTAISFALAWQFEPAKLNGMPQYARFKLTMPFRLR